MWYKRSKKKYDFLVSHSNTPHLREKTIIMGMAYFFAGVNFIINGLLPAKTGGTQIDILLGIVLILMVPISMTDEKRENRGVLAVVGTCIMHMVFCVWLSFMSSPWWMAVYVGEVLLCIGVVFASIKFLKNHH